MLHSHVGLWTLAIVFFIISFILLKAGKDKGQTITHMILRLLYVLVFITGFMLVNRYGFSLLAVIKGLFGLLVIAGMEMTLIRSKKRASSGFSWFLLIIGLIGAFYMGYGVLGA
ncbi:DUF1516 family protein [Tuberibacillus sp. Marseille-P3662]|uniref:DUF1516 family protein n=1 Tax=Tuberibacillus sp. Marseille-P3662 TaxID=1965358 RepID=UPI000A1CD96D|nr:DUF1516 family protein [Tuberibacillus sp. Marseille-P3662]